MKSHFFTVPFSLYPLLPFPAQLVYNQQDCIPSPEQHAQLAIEQGMVRKSADEDTHQRRHIAAGHPADPGTSPPPVTDFPGQPEQLEHHIQEQDQAQDPQFRRYIQQQIVAVVHENIFCNEEVVIGKSITVAIPAHSEGMVPDHVQGTFQIKEPEFCRGVMDGKDRHEPFRQLVPEHIQYTQPSADEGQECFVVEGPSKDKEHPEISHPVPPGKGQDQAGRSQEKDPCQSPAGLSPFERGKEPFTVGHCGYQEGPQDVGVHQGGNGPPGQVLESLVVDPFHILETAAEEILPDAESRHHPGRDHENLGQEQGTAAGTGIPEHQIEQAGFLAHHPQPVEGTGGWVFRPQGADPTEEEQGPQGPADVPGNLDGRPELPGLPDVHQVQQETEPKDKASGQLVQGKDEKQDTEDGEGNLVQVPGCRKAPASWSFHAITDPIPVP